MDGFFHEQIEKVVLPEPTELDISLRLRQVVLDVADEDSRKRAINRVIRESGRIDVLVNNAGVLCAGGSPAMVKWQALNSLPTRSDLGCGLERCPQRFRNQLFRTDEACTTCRPIHG